MGVGRNFTPNETSFATFLTRDSAKTRARVQVLLAAAAIATSFFGSRIIGRGDPTLAGWCAIAAFALVAATVLTVLWPWRDWEFNANPAELIATYIETGSPATLVEVHRDLALHRSASWASNARFVGKLHLALRVGLILVAVEVCAWVVALAGQG
jgi:hypothetical protein